MGWIGSNCFPFVKSRKKKFSYYYFQIKNFQLLIQFNQKFNFFLKIKMKKEESSNPAKKRHRKKKIRPKRKPEDRNLRRCERKNKN